MPPQDTLNRPDASHDGWSTLRRFLPYLWPRGAAGLRARIVFALGLVVVSKLVQLSMAWVYGRAVDRMVPGMEPVAEIAIALVAAYAAARFGGVLFDNLRNVVFERVGQDATRRLAENVFVHLHALSLRFHLNRRTGAVTKVIERGTKSIDVMLYFMLFNIAPTLLELVLVSIYFKIEFGWGMVVATWVMVAAYILFTGKVTNWRNALREKMNELDTQTVAKSVDSLLNYETVKYFNAERREAARYNGVLSQYADAAVKSENSLSLLNIGQSLITNVMMAGAMGYVVWGWSKGQFSTGDVVTINTLLAQLFRPLDMLGMVYRTIRQGITDMAAMFNLLDQHQEVADAPGAPALVVNRPTLAFDQVVFGYEHDRTILKGLSFEVPAGHQVALVGPSGAGKSTIARLVFRFYDPWSGKILIDGQDIRGVTQESLRKVLGIVPQDTVLFNDTIGYNIAYGRGDANLAEVEEAARKAALIGLIERLPQGLDTEVGERGLKLSGGEKQRVAIARTLVKNPPILLLDEATSALDTRTEQEILATLHTATAGRTSLSIAHRLSTVADADRILVLNDGQLAEQGTHAQLLRKRGLYAEMWARQAEAIEETTE